METFDPYKILGVRKNASATVIRRAYRKLSKSVHPDVNSSPEAEEEFKRLKRAHDILTDAEKRRAYDSTGDADAAERDMEETIKGLQSMFLEVFEKEDEYTDLIRKLNELLDRNETLLTVRDIPANGKAQVKVDRAMRRLVFKPTPDHSVAAQSERNILKEALEKKAAALRAELENHESNLQTIRDMRLQLAPFSYDLGVVSKPALLGKLEEKPRHRLSWAH